MTLTTESKRGSDCSGSDAATSRVLTLANTVQTLAGGFTVYVNGALLVPTTEYSITHNSSSSTITFVNLVFNTDYIIVVYLQTGGVPTTPNYCTYSDVYNRTGLTSTEVSNAVMDELIVDAEAELEMITGRKFTDANSFTDFISMGRKDVLENQQRTFLVSHWPIQSITTCEVLDSDGNATDTYDTISTAEILAGTYESEDYWLEVMNDPTINANVPTRTIKLKTDTVSKGTNNIKVVYTYGYSNVPRVITNLAASLAGIRAWVLYLGGQYQGANDYSLADFSVNKGDIYNRGKQNMVSLKEETERLLDRVGRKSRTLFFATGGDR